jgi:hypothetical protein
MCIPASVVILGTGCFSGCSSLAKLTFEGGSRLSQIAELAFADCSSLKSMFIPKMVRILTRRCFSGCSSLSSVVFESGSNLELIESGAFCDCRVLDSLSLPASLTVLSEHALCKIPLLKSLTFESGSKLREIHDSVFGGCESLKSIFLPASLSTLSAATFLSSSIKEILVDAANPHYFVSGPFLVCVEGMRLIRSFSLGEDLEADCLCKLGLSQICPEAFLDCSALKSLYIPASIEILGEKCFLDCSSLSQIIFEPGSQITVLGSGTFDHCSSLTSICIPANVESIGEGCFRNCTSLVEVSFEPGSKLTRIYRHAFLCCTSLPSFVIPAQLEIIACDVFSGCTSLCEIMFDDPSHLKELDLPPSEFGSLCIPNCVEVVSGRIGTQPGQQRVLYFDEKSGLNEISMWQSVYSRDAVRNSESRACSFLRLPEMALRRVRCKFEAL